MEVTSTSKRLHVHAVPVLLVLFGLFGLGVIAQVRYGTLTPSSAARIGRALTTQSLHITPTKNGLAQVEVGKDKATVVKNTDMSQTGRSAELSFTMQ